MTLRVLKKLLLGAIIAIGLPNPLSAGTWVGGGGEFVMDSQNPWFLENTKIIKACIEIDRDHFHLPVGKPDLQRDFIEPVFNYWRSELAFGSSQLSDTQDEKMPKVGTQIVEFGPCDTDTDLRFQFGFLSDSQRAALKAQGQDPRQFVSIAVRTEYDRIHLKGKGFIYISADSGELRPEGKEMKSQPWADVKGVALRNVLAHEVGHIFGLQHASGEIDVESELMGSGYAEYMATRWNSPVDIGIPPFFSRSRVAGMANCFGPSYPIPEQTVTFLNLHPIPDCLFIGRPTVQGRLEVKGYLRTGENQTSYGFITLSSQQSVVRDIRRFIHLWLPPEQVAFPDYGPRRLIWLPYVKVWRQYLAQYRDASGNTPRMVLVDEQPGIMTRVFGITDTWELLDPITPQNLPGL